MTIHFLGFTEMKDLHYVGGWEWGCGQLWKNAEANRFMSRGSAVRSIRSTSHQYSKTLCVRTNIFISGDSHSGKREREMRKGLRGGEMEGGRKQLSWVWRCTPVTPGR